MNLYYSPLSEVELEVEVISIVRSTVTLGLESCWGVGVDSDVELKAETEGEGDARRAK